MPMESVPDRSLKIVNTVCEGVMMLNDITHYQMTVWLEPSIQGYNELFDFNGSDFSNIEFGDLIDIAKGAAKVHVFKPNAKFAFLTQSAQHNAVAEFYIAAKELSTAPSRKIKTFTSRSEAIAWLTE